MGDKVRFARWLPHGRPARPADEKLPIITPAAQAIAGSSTPPGAPFWFNGQPQVGFNRQLLTSAFGKSRSYDGSKARPERPAALERPKPMTVNFKKAGTSATSATSIPA